MTTINQNATMTTAAPRYNLDVNHRRTRTNMTITFKTPFYTTGRLTHIIPLLLAYLPRIFESKCFNDQDLSFHDEAKDTELGHLYEHILLEYLVSLKFVLNHQHATHRATTSWDWNQDEPGTFHITIDTAGKDAFILYQAISQTNRLMNLILNHPSLRKN